MPRGCRAPWRTSRSSTSAALAFPRAQPGVAPRRVAVLGLSRGSEAAQLLVLGAYYPDRVRGVVALVPSDAVHCGYPDLHRAAWTWHGRPLPCTKQADQPAPTDVPAAVLPYDRIAAPLFLACAGHDLLWASCPYAYAAMARHAATHHRTDHPAGRRGHGACLRPSRARPG